MNIIITLQDGESLVRSFVAALTSCYLTMVPLIYVLSKFIYPNKFNYLNT